MKSFCSLIVIFILTMSSCVNEEDYFYPEKMDVTINGGIENINSKLSYITTLDSTSFHFSWSANDQVSLIIDDNSTNNTNNEFIVTTADVYSPMYGTVTEWKGNCNIFAVYPYNSEGYSLIGRANNKSLAISADLQQISVGNGNDRINNGLMVAYLKSVAFDNLLFQTLRFEQTMCFIQLLVINIPATEHITSIGLEDESCKIPIKWNFNILSSSYQSLPDSTSSQLYANVQKSLSGIPTLINFAMIPFNFGNPNIGGTGKLSVYIETTNLEGSVKSYMVKDLERINFARNTIYKISSSLKGLTGLPVTDNHQRIK